MPAFFISSVPFSLQQYSTNIKAVTEIHQTQTIQNTQMQLDKTTEQKDPELTTSHGNTKITTICRTTIDEKDQNLQEKILYN